MTVTPEITREVMEAELADANLEEINVDIEPDLENLLVTVTMTSPIDDEVYIAEFDCENYREHPPNIEMIDPETGDREVPSAYFDDDTDLIATPNDDVVICMGFNRQVFETDGIHDNWNLAGWENEARGHTTLGEMIGRLYQAIADDRQYNGRFA